MRDIIVIGSVVAVSLYAVSRPAVGILAYICFVYVNPNAFTWGFGRTFPVAMLPALATLLGYLFSSKSKKIPFEREFKLLIGLWGAFTLSTIFAIHRSSAWAEYQRISKIFLMIFVASSLIDNREKLHWLIRCMALPLGLIGMKLGLWAIIHGGTGMVWGPEDTWLEANNTIGFALAMNVPLLFHLLKLEINQWLRRLIKAMMFLAYPAVVCTYSRGAWLGLAAVTALMTLKMKHKLVSIIAIAILCGLIQPLLPKELKSRYDTLENYEEDGSAQSRLWVWVFCTHVALSRPLTGGGFDLYSQEAYERYYPEITRRFPGKLFSAHSIWFSVMAEHGIPGISIWISLIISSFLSLRQLRATGKIREDLSWIVPFTEMAQASLVAFVVSGSFIDASYFENFYHLLLVIIVMKVIVHQSRARDCSDAFGTDMDGIVLKKESYVPVS